MIKSKQIVKWGGIDNTIIPKMQDDIKEQNTLLNEQEKIQGRLFELETKITAAKKGAMAGDKEQLKVRIDDKLNRLLQGNANIEKDEDVIKDLIGYLILLLISMES